MHRAFNTHNTPLYYAIGGGLGHLTRARAVLYTLDINEATILTASHAAPDSRINGGFDVRLVPPELSGDRSAYRAWLHETIDAIAPTTIFIDTFPAGILGEFCDFTFPADTELIYIARLLRWNEYAKVMDGAVPCFDRTFRVEELTAEHEAFVQAHSRESEPFALIDPPAEVADVEEIITQVRSDDRPLWLVVHSGPKEEIEGLVAYARDRAVMEAVESHLVLISSLAIPGIPCFDIYPATPLFPYADRIITACGFNAMRQLAPWRRRHWFVPMLRRYDDQFLRAGRTRAVTDGIESVQPHDSVA